MWLCFLVFKRWRFIASGAFLLALFLSSSLMGLVTAFCAMLFLGITTGSTLALVASGISALLCFYIKINYGIILAPLWLASLVLTSFSGKLKWHRAALLVLGWGLMLMGSARLFNVTLPGYLKGGLALISGYNEAMAIPVDVLDRTVLPAWGILISFAALMLWNVRTIIRDPCRVILYTITALFLFLVFKNGYVRADTPHIMAFLACCPVIIGLLALFEPKHTARPLMVLMCLALVAGQANPAFRIRNISSYVVSILWPRAYLSELINPEITAKKCTFSSEQESARYIPPTILTSIKTGRVDAVSIDVLSIYINHLHYRPRPVPQSYQAYNGYLDNLNAGKYASPSAPDTIIYQNKTIDNRHPFWDESITKRVMLAQYEFSSDSIFDEAYYLKRYPDIAGALKEGKIPKGAQWHYEVAGRKEGRLPGFLYLQRRSHPLVATYTMDRKESLKFSTPFCIEHNDNLLYLNAHVRYSILGWLRSILFQPAPIFATLTYDNGQQDTFRACRPILKTGVLLNKKITDNEDTAMFFKSQGRTNAEVVSITFTTPYPSCFRRSIPSEIWKLHFK